MPGKRSSPNDPLRKGAKLENRAAGLRLLQAIKEAGEDLGYEEVGAAVGVSDKSISDYIGGINSMNLKARQLADYLGVTAEWLLFGTGGQYQESTGVSYLEYRNWRKAVDKEFSKLRKEIAELREQLEGGAETAPKKNPKPPLALKPL